MDDTDTFKGHNWSGWPGAYCLNCGIEDPVELCIAHDKVVMICNICEEDEPEEARGEDGHVHDILFYTCDEHKVERCQGA